jgi:hypothetical protein
VTRNSAAARIKARVGRDVVLLLLFVVLPVSFLAFFEIGKYAPGLQPLHQLMHMAFISKLLKVSKYPNNLLVHLMGHIAWLEVLLHDL